MKKLLSLGLVFLFSGITSMTLSGSRGQSGQGQNGKARGGNEGFADRLVGAWRLVSLEQEGEGGKIQRADSTGLLVFTPDGHISVQVMERNPPAQASARPEQYSQGGYEASFGTYEIKESTHTFTFQIEGALVRSLIGKDLPRAFEFSGKQLIVKSTRPNEH